MGYVILLVAVVIAAVLLRREVRDPRPVVVGSRPSVFRVLVGGLLLGPVGAIAGYAFRKKTRARVGARPVTTREGTQPTIAAKEGSGGGNTYGFSSDEVFGRRS